MTSAYAEPAFAAESRAGDRGHLFAGYGAICVVISVGGFFPSFWMQLPSGSFTGSSLVIVHGLLFTAWTMLLLSQAILVERGQLRRHRAWGMAGISLASMLLLLGIATATSSIEARLAAGFGVRARSFAIVPLSNIVLFFGFFAGAVANIPRSDWHKRLMLVATSAALTAAVARFIFLIVDGRAFGASAAKSPPGTVVGALRPSAVVAILMVGAMLYDRRQRGAFHPAWFWGIGIYVTVSLVRIPIAESPQWLAFTEFLVNFG
jgi:hypothetical protein